MASLACSSIASDSDASYSSPVGTSPAIYIQQGEAKNVAEALELYVSGTATSNSGQNEGQLLAMNVDHLSSSVGAVGLNQPARVASLPEIDLATAEPTSSLPASSAVSGIDQNAIPFLADSGDDADSDDDLVVGGRTLSSETAHISPTFTGSSTPTPPSPDADEDDGEEGQGGQVVTGLHPFNSFTAGDGATDSSASEPDDEVDAEDEITSEPIVESDDDASTEEEVDPEPVVVTDND